MSRFARSRKVYFFEEPVIEPCEPHLRSTVCAKTGVRVHTPVLPPDTPPHEALKLQRELLSDMISNNYIESFIEWYYTPMARQFASGLGASVTIYDCMDELSAFAGAPVSMRENEQALLREADLVFTGGQGLYETKRKQHASAHLFPSSVDTAHFARARSLKSDPADQAQVPHPRLGYAGVIDERMDLELVRKVAEMRPDWHLIMLGPVAKINPADLPQAPNIHYLGLKQYAELPAYLSGWDIGMLPFALNESTRFISPTKTPEYLAAGLQVISTPIRDVSRPYGDLGLVRIAHGPDEFVRASEALLGAPISREFRISVDRFLAKSSWDKTWSDMNRLIEEKMMVKDLAVGRRKPATRAEVFAEGAAHV